MIRAGISRFLAALAVIGLVATQAACGGQTPNSESSAVDAAGAPAGAGSPEAPAASPQAPEARDQAVPPEQARPAPASPAPAPRAVEPAPVKPAPPPPPRTFTLAADRPIAVHTTSTLSTSVNKTGERFTATLAEPIVDGDWTIAGRGAVVEGVVVDSDPGGRTKGVASITIALKQLTLADGRTIVLATSSVTEEANTSKGKDAKKIGIGAGVGAAIGAIAGGGSGAAIGAAVGGGAGAAGALATRGDPATVPSESLVTFMLTSPVTITRVNAR